jgi:hypothetical protein
MWLKGDGNIDDLVMKSMDIRSFLVLLSIFLPPETM